MCELRREIRNLVMIFILTGHALLCIFRFCLARIEDAEVKGT